MTTKEMVESWLNQRKNRLRELQLQVADWKTKIDETQVQIQTLKTEIDEIQTALAKL